MVLTVLRYHLSVGKTQEVTNNLQTADSEEMMSKQVLSDSSDVNNITQPKAFKVCGRLKRAEQAVIGAERKKTAECIIN